MNLPLSHHSHLFVISSIPSKPHRHQSPFLSHPKPKTTTTQPITCKVLINPSSPNTLSPNQPPPPSPSSSIPTTPPALNPFMSLASAALDAIEKHIVTKLEKNLNRMIDPAVQLEGNYAPVQECPVQHNLEVVDTIDGPVVQRSA